MSVWHARWWTSFFFLPLKANNIVKVKSSFFLCSPLWQRQHPGVGCISYIRNELSWKPLMICTHQFWSAVLWGVTKRPLTSNLSKWWCRQWLPHPNTNQTMRPSIYNPFYFSLSLSLSAWHRVFITDPSAQCWTLASAARFNERKLGTKNRPVVKGHVAPSASIQTMENLTVFSFQLPPNTPH